jgi:hypothetical protein
MEISSWYWVILVIWALFYGWGNWSDGPNGRYGRLGGGVVLFVLLVLIGLKVMGSIVK